MKKIWVTGASGFLGRNLCKRLGNKGDDITGIGFSWSGRGEPADFGIDHWHSGQVTVAALTALKFERGAPDIFYHCAGGASVGLSITDPYGEYQKTVGSLVELLEFIRLDLPKAAIIYPSSGAVYGSVERGKIIETTERRPVSPYGVHKKIAETLIHSYATLFNVEASVIRFFSLYGSGLKKQLLWDLCEKLKEDPAEITLHGTGAEERDWIHVDDATLLMELASEHTASDVRFINGGVGRGVTTREIAEEVRDAFDSKALINFNNIVREGDPRYFHADTAGADSWGFEPKKDLSEGIAEYVAWYKLERGI